MSEKIVLKASFPGVDRVRRETLEAEPLGNGAYRLLQSPGFVSGIAAGDEIQLDENATHGYRMLKHGGNLCVWVALDNAGVESAALIEPFQRRLEKLGGYLDGGTEETLTFTVPVSAGWNPIEAVFKELAAAVPGASWCYGNVWDPVDEVTPLNWWLDA
jgi:hypothetical protein